MLAKSRAVELEQFVPVQASFFHWIVGAPSSTPIRRPEDRAVVPLFHGVADGIEIPVLYLVDGDASTWMEQHEVWLQPVEMRVDVYLPLLREVANEEIEHDSLAALERAAQ